jgi:NO-binding membrane sensor protein with MHYT domain
MPELHHLTYGPINLIAAYLLAFGGSLLALWSAQRGRAATGRGHRARWLLIASVSLGGAIWLMHFAAMLGFEVVDTSLRYDVGLTGASAAMAIVVVGIGIFVVGWARRRSAARLIIGGVFAGTGVAAMHYTGMAAMRLAGSIGYDPGLVAASVVIAVVAATVALWFTLTIRGWVAAVIGAAVMAIAVCAMHYTGMAALRVRLSTEVRAIGGLDPLLLIMPITAVTALALIGVIFVAMQAMNEDVPEVEEPKMRPYVSG